MAIRCGGHERPSRSLTGNPSNRFKSQVSSAKLLPTTMLGQTGCKHHNTLLRFQPGDSESTIINLLIGTYRQGRGQPADSQSWTATREAICRMPQAGSVANRRRG